MGSVGRGCGQGVVIVDSVCLVCGECVKRVWRVSGQCVEVIK